MAFKITEKSSHHLCKITLYTVTLCIKKYIFQGIIFASLFTKLMLFRATTKKVPEPTGIFAQFKNPAVGVADDYSNGRIYDYYYSAGSGLIYGYSSLHHKKASKAIFFLLRKTQG